MPRLRMQEPQPQLKEPVSSQQISLLLTRGENDELGVLHNVDADSLSEHVVITGGQSELRTELCKKILDGILPTQLPFLVFTSSRAYRSLLETSEHKDSLVVYTLGQSVFPLAVNMFELVPGVSVASHINRLCAIFRKIYSLSVAATHALEKNFTALYERRGWNLLDNSNSRLSPEQDATYHAEVYPILAESLEILDDTIEASIFDAAVKTEIKSNLQAILNSLIFGVNRSIFNARSAASVVDIFRQRVIIESAVMRAPQDRSMFAALLLNFNEELLEPSNRHLQHVFILDDCSQMSELFDPVETEDSVAATRITANLDSFTSAGHGIIFSGLRGTQFESTGLNQTGLTAVFQERNTRAMSKLAGFHSLNLSSLNLVKTLLPYQVLLLVNCDNVDEANVQIEKGVKQRESSPGANPPLSEGGFIFGLESNLVKAQTMGITDEQLEELNKSVIHPHHHLVQKGAEYFPEAFDLDSLAIAEKLLLNKSFYAIFVRYVASFTKDLTQLVHFRAQLIHEVQRLTGRKTPEFLRKISWCSISFASDRYFGAKALLNHWTLDEERDLMQGWFELMAPAFVPDSANPNLQRRLDIGQVRGWRDQFLALETIEQGPFPACGPCTSKCLLGYDVAQFLTEPGLFFDFNSAISRRDAPASDSSAWYVRLLCERLIGQFNLDLAYCLAVHFIKTQQLSTDAQLVLLRKVRQHLEQVGLSDDTNQIDRGKKGDEVRIIQFPKMTRD